MLGRVLVYAVVDDSLSPTSPLSDSLDVFVRRDDAERFIEDIRARARRHRPFSLRPLRLTGTGGSGGSCFAFVIVGFALSVAAATALSGSLGGPSDALIARSLGWLVLTASASLLLATPRCIARGLPSGGPRAQRERCGASTNVSTHSPGVSRFPQSATAPRRGAWMPKSRAGATPTMAAVSRLGRT